VTISEVRFASPGRTFYVQGLAFTALGVGLIAFGLLFVVIEPRNLTHAVYIASAVFVVLAGAALTLLVWFIFIGGAISTWQRWRQFRPPAVVVDAAGVRYLAPRRPAVVPWPDIEKVSLNRTVFRNRVVTRVVLLLDPGAALLRDSAIPVPASRFLGVGTMATADVPVGTALRFLAALAGDRLEVTEVDRRKPAADPARG
jgi:hypothetical protein